MRKLFLHLSLVVLSLISLYADGVLAETNSGKIVMLEWTAYGTVLGQQQVTGADLKILDKNGKLLFQETFTPFKKFEFAQGGGEYGDFIEYFLVLQGSKTKVDLQFKGNLTPVPKPKTKVQEGWSEMQLLTMPLKASKRKKPADTYLVIETPIGKFSFSDVIYGMFGDF